MTNLAIASFICIYKSSAVWRKGATHESGLTDWVVKICFTSKILCPNDFLYNVDTPGIELADAKVDSLQKQRWRKFNGSKEPDTHAAAFLDEFVRLLLIWL